MAKAKTKATMFLNLAVMLSLVLLISVAEGRLFTFGKPSPPVCESVYGVLSGDTCFEVQQQFNLTAEEFEGINPNLQCNKLFAGQWLCVVGIP